MNQLEINTENIAKLTGGKISPAKEYAAQPVSQIITDSRTFFKSNEAVKQLNELREKRLL